MATSRKRAGRSGKRLASGAANTQPVSQFTPAMSADEVAFIHAIADAPDDDTPRVVYADWLDEHDRPERAEFIRVQCELARCPADSLPRDLLEREWALLDERGGTWLAELGQWRRRDWLFDPCPRHERRRGEPGVRHPLAARLMCWVPWFERGFLTLISPQRSSFHLRNRVWLDSPLLRLVTEIDMHASGIGDRDAELLAASEHVRGVKRLALFANAVGDRGAAALAVSPNLTGLTCLSLFNNYIGNAGAIALARSDSLPKLETLLLATNRIGDVGGRAFLTTCLPSLKCLSLDNNPVSDPVADELESLADTTGGFRVQFSSGWEPGVRAPKRSRARS